ncbi:MAG: lecithin retinol acyltransferase family protein [Acholeplasmatales bacterium]|nr:lecithin retinol acyltransferase family protein [Acholeplasmatales bacterium]
MWVNKKPEYGDQIRVNRGFYYHHGIYESDDAVYHFASPMGSEISPETAVVHKTTLENFLKGSPVEVREYTNEELLNKRKPEEIIDYAKAHIGEKGYNLVSNNCEHFSNRCAFGKSDSDQVKNVLNFLFGGGF